MNYRSGGNRFASSVEILGVRSSDHIDFRIDVVFSAGQRLPTLSRNFRSTSARVIGMPGKPGTFVGFAADAPAIVENGGDARWRDAAPPRRKLRLLT